MPLDASNWSLLTAASAALLGLWLIACAYREGRRAGAQTRCERWSRLTSGFRLHGTCWNVAYTDYGSEVPRERRGTVRFRQHDARVLAEGRDESGSDWTAEGVALDDKLCLALVESDAATTHLGAVIVDCRDGDGVLLGLRCIWSRSNSATIQPIRFEPASADARANAPAATMDSGNTG